MSDTHAAPPPPPPVAPARPEAGAPPPPPAAPSEKSKGDKPHRPFYKELPVLIVVAFVVALLLKTFALQAFYIPSASMEPTLLIGDRVLVEKVSYRFGEPDHGDVVVFEKDFGGDVIEEDRSVFEKIGDAFRGLFGFPTGTAQDYIKRVIGTEGDVVEGRDGTIFVNGDRVDESYLPDGVVTSAFGPVEVPDGMIFVMGDNRGNSEDSRAFGPVPVDTVVGKAFLLIWPPSDFDTL